MGSLCDLLIGSLLEDFKTAPVNNVWREPIRTHSGGWIQENYRILFVDNYHFSGQIGSSGGVSRSPER